MDGTKRLPSSEAGKAWWKGFKAGARLLKPHDGRRLPAQGAAHFCAEFADAAVEEYRRRFGVSS